MTTEHFLTIHQHFEAMNGAEGSRIVTEGAGQDRGRGRCSGCLGYGAFCQHDSSHIIFLGELGFLSMETASLLSLLDGFLCFWLFPLNLPPM